MRKVDVDVKVRVVLNCDDDADVVEVLNEMDYEFYDTTSKADVMDTEILDFEIKDSK